MEVFRIRIAKDIVAECCPPKGYGTRVFKHKSRVAILCEGMPTVPSKHRIIEFLSKKGFWVFHPRYRGAWESGGALFKHEPTKDIQDVLHHISQGKVRNLQNGKIFELHPQPAILFGSSFGGPAALGASSNPLVEKVVAFSPVTDWTHKSKDEPIPFLKKYVAEAFGNGYRISHNGWRKIQGGKFYNPIHFSKKIVGNKVLIFHCRDDHVVDWKSVQYFANRTQVALRTYKTGGHLGLSILMMPKYWKHIQRFISG